MILDELLFDKKTPGEYDLKWSLRKNGYEVKDVSGNPNYWEKDIDLIATNTSTNITTTIEVKWDKRISATGNMFIELENPRSKGGIGWFNFCEADLLAYGDSINRIFYFIRLADLRQFIKEHKLDLNCRTTGDGSYGYLLPLAIVEHLFECVVRV